MNDRDKWNQRTLEALSENVRANIAKGDPEALRRFDDVYLSALFGHFTKYFVGNANKGGSNSIDDGGLEDIARDAVTEVREKIGRKGLRDDLKSIKAYIFNMCRNAAGTRISKESARNKKHISISGGSDDSDYELEAKLTSSFEVLPRLANLIMERSQELVGREEEYFRYIEQKYPLDQIALGGFDTGLIQARIKTNKQVVEKLLLGKSGKDKMTGVMVWWRDFANRALRDILVEVDPDLNDSERGILDRFVGIRDD